MTKFITSVVRSSVTGTHHLYNAGTRTTGCGRKPRTGEVMWPVSGEFEGSNTSGICLKCLEWYQRALRVRV